MHVCVLYRCGFFGEATGSRDFWNLKAYENVEFCILDNLCMLLLNDVFHGNVKLI